MTDASALRLRLGAIGAALRAVDGTDRHEALSRVQSNAVVAMLQRVWANISPEDKAALALMIHNVDWYQGHDGPIMAILGRDSAAASNRQAQQKYTTFPEFFTQDTWSKLMPDDGEVPPSTACLHIIIQRVVRLGGCSVCERTTKLMSSMWVLITDPNAYKLSSFQLKAHHGYVKREYRTIADKFPRPDNHMDTLPNLPGDLARSHPQAYAKAYSTRAGDGPMRCPLDMTKLRDLDNRYRCRGVGSEKHAAQPMGGGQQGSGYAASGQLVPFAPSGGSQDDIRQMIAQQAQNMQQMQQMAMTAMSLVAGGRVGAGAGSAGDEMASFMETLEVFGNASRSGRHTTNPAGRRIAGPHLARASQPATDLADPLAADAADPLAADTLTAAPAAAARAPPAAAPAADAADPAAAAPADSAGAVALAAPANAPQTLAPSLKRTVDQAMDTMQAKREEAKAKSKAKRVMKRPAAKPAKEKKGDEEEEEGRDYADADEVAESADEAVDEGEDEDEDEDPPPTPAAKSSRATKKVLLSVGKRGEGDKAAKLSPPKTKAKKATKATNATSPKMKAAKVTPPKTKADTKPIDISDLAVLTKKTMNATTRECFTSKAYHTARKRAKHAGKSSDIMKALGRKAYAASAASWDKLKGS